MMISLNRGGIGVELGAHPIRGTHDRRERCGEHRTIPAARPPGRLPAAVLDERDRLAVSTRGHAGLVEDAHVDQQSEVRERSGERLDGPDPRVGACAQLPLCPELHLRRVRCGLDVDELDGAQREILEVCALEDVSHFCRSHLATARLGAHLDLTREIDL